MSAMAVGMASRVASVAVGEAEKEMKKKMESGERTMPCIGAHCCKTSTCMNIPGFRCSRERGPTKCVGSSAFPPIQGMCACLAGPCSPEGTCSSDGLPQTFETESVSAPASDHAQPVAGSLSTWQTQALATERKPAAAGQEQEYQFNTWHRTASLFGSSPPLAIADHVPRENLPLALLSCGVFIGSVLSFLSCIVVRIGNAYRQRHRLRRSCVRDPLSIDDLLDGESVDVCGSDTEK